MPYRSAVTGEYVDEEYAKAHPDETVFEEQQEGAPMDEKSEDEDDGPAKPPIEDMPPEEGLELSAEELENMAEDVPEEDFMPRKKAEEDDTVDDAEQAQQPHQDLPEGSAAAEYARREQEEIDRDKSAEQLAEDVEKEKQDGEEETPPASEPIG